MTDEDIARLQRFATASLLSAGLAHEISNPLSALSAALHALDARLGRIRARGAVDAGDIADLAADVELARLSEEELSAVVRDFQIYLRPNELDTGAAIDPKPAVVRALRMARVRLGSVGAVSVAMSDVPQVRVPPNRITQIVLNLLINAADALAGRPWSANLVELRLETVGGWAVIEVKDNGPGLDGDVRQRLFQVGATTKGNSLGLGLAICRDLVRQSGGDISVSSPLVPGTAFRIVLPPAALGRPGRVASDSSVAQDEQQQHDDRDRGSDHRSHAVGFEAIR
jgi:signal transduction histidine kinase